MVVTDEDDQTISQKAISKYLQSNDSTPYRSEHNRQSLKSRDKADRYSENAG